MFNAFFIRPVVLFSCAECNRMIRRSSLCKFITGQIWNDLVQVLAVDV